MEPERIKGAKETASPFTKIISPYRQAVLFLIGMPVMLFLFLVPSKLGMFSVDQYFPWTVAASFTLLFALCNCILSLGATNRNLYWGQSIIAYIVVMVLGGLMAWLISGQGIYEIPSFRQIYIVFTIGYILLLSIVRAMRKLMQIAIDQDAKLRGEE